jgi:hypothetical protein
MARVVANFEVGLPTTGCSRQYEGAGGEGAVAGPPGVAGAAGGGWAFGSKVQ